MSSAAIFGLIWLGITLLSMVVKAANKEPQQGQQSGPAQGRPQQPASFDDFVRQIERAQRQATREEAPPRPRPRPAPDRPRRRVRVAPAAPRIVAAPSPSDQALTEHHLHSALETPRDLSDVDERHIADHIQERSRSTGPGIPTELQTQVSRAMTEERTDAPTFNFANFAPHLTPLQRAFVMGELLHKSPAFEMQGGLDSDSFH